LIGHFTIIDENLDKKKIINERVEIIEIDIKFPFF
jgi:hypothetical protein